MSSQFTLFDETFITRKTSYKKSFFNLKVVKTSDSQSIVFLSHAHKSRVAFWDRLYTCTANTTISVFLHQGGKVSQIRRMVTKTRYSYKSQKRREKIENNEKPANDRLHFTKAKHERKHGQNGHQYWPVGGHIVGIVGYTGRLLECWLRRSLVSLVVGLFLLR